ncbi:hypothetical protein CsatB_028601 [Cannabis sativa]|uniref:Cystatin domain-containing protein n=2 Tax=Cannabis sativa TaxID=3483 RepID=A0A7J6G6J7_CANSA|nr:hypothetical protein G4B88_027527 [Cannabis sativa]
MEDIVGKLREVEGSESDPKMKELARFAIEFHNENKNYPSLNLAFVKIIGVFQEEVVSGIMYSMQFHALDVDELKVLLCSAGVLVKEDNSKEADYLLVITQV